MNRDDNIKKFFKKRLDDSSPADDLWNVPSDDIWNKAKVHFPKEKKKRRGEKREKALVTRIDD